jgi:hypothetical protein
MMNSRAEHASIREYNFATNLFAPVIIANPDMDVPNKTTIRRLVKLWWVSVLENMAELHCCKVILYVLLTNRN